MKTSNFIKIFSIIVMSISIILFSTKVMAADDLDLYEDMDLIPANSSKENTNSNVNSNTNTNTNTNSNTNSDSLNFNKGNTNSNTNSNNSTNLPKTGIEDSVPVAMLVVVFGISSIYAYKKIKEYRNI